MVRCQRVELILVYLITPVVLTEGMGVTVIRNKADISGENVGMDEHEQYPVIRLSAKNAEGIELVRTHLKAD